MTTSIASRKSQGKCSIKIALFSIATVILIGSAGNINAQNNLIPAVRPCLADSFTPVTQSMGDPNLRYIDPEVLRGSDKIAYQDKAGNLWVGTLDATTGKFASQTGHDLLVDTDFSLAAYQINSRSHPGDTSLWLLGLGSDSSGHFCRKVDEGSIPDKPQTRYEPETYLGTSDLFFYYNIENAVDPELGQIRVVNTGISY